MPESTPPKTKPVPKTETSAKPEPTPPKTLLGVAVDGVATVVGAAASLAGFAYAPPTVTFTDHTGARQAARVNAIGKVALTAITSVDGVNPGEVFGELPALALQLVASGRAAPLDPLAFSPEAVSSVRAHGGDEVKKVTAA
jgi:hypothetical protein